MQKNTILFGISIVNVVLFLIGFIILIVGDASDNSNNYAFSLSIISGIIFEIVTIVQIVKEKKSDKEGRSFFPYCVACFKKKNGKPMYQLVMAAILNVLPLALFIMLLIVLVLFTSSDSKTANNISKGINLISDNSQTSGKSNPKKSTENQSEKSGESGANKDLSYQEYNHIAGSTNNDMKQVSEGEFKEIQKIYKENPGISDEDAFEIHKKHHPGTTMETVRGCKPSLDMTYEEINHIAGSTSNDMKQVLEGEFKEIQKIYKENPGISDEDAFAAHKKHHPGTTIETVRSCKPSLDMTYEEINHIASNTSNNLKQISEGTHKEIQKIYKNNPGISDEDAFAIINKTNKAINVETVRAHKPR